MSREIDKELQSHIAQAIKQGRDPAETWNAFGAVLRHREANLDIRLATCVGSARADAGLALAIGACTSAFRLIDALLLRPFPSLIRNASVAVLSYDNPAGCGRSNLQRDHRQALLALGILVMLVLAIACAKVANLMTAPASAVRGTGEQALRCFDGSGVGGRWTVDHSGSTDRAGRPAAALRARRRPRRRAALRRSGKYQIGGSFARID